MRVAEPSRFLCLAATLGLGACWPELVLEGPADTDTPQSEDTEDNDTTSTAGADNPCYDVRCVTPPADACNPTGDAVIRHNRNGWCELNDDAARCRYDSYEETCGDDPCTVTPETGLAECADTPSPSNERYCLSPPAPVCLGDDLLISYPGGAAVEEGCEYPIRTLRCAAGCDAATGGCKDDPCMGKICADPPAPFCAGDELVRWAPFGRCTDKGRCAYIKEVVPCDTGCGKAACRETDRCDHRVCNAPPAPFCLNEKTLFVYDGLGACDNGACIYSGEPVLCGGECNNGRCTDDPCLGVHCNFPTAPSCAAEGMIRFWDGAPFPEEVPLCRDGVCRYQTDEMYCGESGCLDGRCRKDACAGMQPYCSDIHTPAAHCTVQGAATYDTPGVCDGAGSCTYAEVLTACDGECDLGRCAGAPAD